MSLACLASSSAFTSTIFIVRAILINFSPTKRLIYLFGYSGIYIICVMKTVDVNAVFTREAKHAGDTHRYLEQSVTKYVYLIGPLLESNSLRIMPGI